MQLRTSTVRKQNVFLPSQVARLLRCSPRTVVKWCDQGRLPCYRLPGSQDRRITRQALIEFVAQHGLPTPDINGYPVLCLVMCPEKMTNEFKVALPKWETFTAATHYLAAAVILEHAPEAVVVDFSCGRSASLELCRDIRNSPAMKDSLIVALVPSDTLVDLRSTDVDNVFTDGTPAEKIADYLALERKERL